MNYFEQLLEIKTGKKELLIKAVYVLHSTYTGEWTYFVYYYDIHSHSFFVNDIDNLCNNTRTKAINIIENIVTKAYHQEMNSFAPILQKLQMRKIPKVFLMYIQTKTNEVIIDEIKLNSIRKLDETIIGFKNPTWT